ncbi:MAG: hypothetical protein HC934_01360 [Acaryochloridaceae cyanobacterium SU_2_1]|nr:hypothetical protein [Acaryochloridaceae cyanobacterium SU_2_1]
MSRPNFYNSDHDSGSGKPEEDAQLVSFLRAHAPPIPEAPADLEVQLMQQIQAWTPEPSGFTEVATPLPKSQSPQAWRLSWLVGVGIVLLAGLGWLVRQWVTPSSSYSLAELAELEEYLSASWHDMGEPRETFEEWDWLESPQQADQEALSLAQSGQASTFEAKH